VVEQLLLRRGAFDEGQQRHRDHAEAVEEVEEEVRGSVRATGKMRIMAWTAVALVLLALVLIVAAIVLR
jgi:t-SNARE complex subunit (syntaxin)